MSSSPHRVEPAQLVQLAEIHLRRAKRRQLDKMESLWLSLQSVILLQTALERLPEDIDPVSPAQTLTHESVQMKIAHAKNDVYSYLKSIVDEQVLFSADSDENRTVISDWLLLVLDYFKCKFTDDGNTETETSRAVWRTTQSSAGSGYSSREDVSVRSFSPLSRPETPNAETKMLIDERIKTLHRDKERRPVPPPRESILDKINYEKMLLTFNTATAAKYGVSVLDKRCQKTIEDYRNSNVSFESNLTASSSVGNGSVTEPTIRSRSNNSYSKSKALRPSSLDLGSGAHPTISRRFSSVVSNLKCKAEHLRRRNTISSPVVSWQTAIKQHKSMINEILTDFSTEAGVERRNADLDTSSSVNSALSERISPPEAFIGGFHANGSVESVKLQIQTVTTKTVSTRYLSDKEIMKATCDKNGNRHEIYRKGSILDTDIKVTYAKSGSLTPDARECAIPTTMRRAYSLHSFEPVSPLTEMCTLPWPDKTRDLSMKTSDTSPYSVSISEDDVLHTLASSFRELAERNFSDQKYEEAQNLYEQSLSILNRMYRVSGKFEPSVIDIMKQCGLIRKFKGDSLGAMGIFEQAIGVIEKRENGHCSRENCILVAELWYEMGNALILDGKHSETVGHSVITILKDRETLDFLDAPKSIGSDMDLENCYNAYTTKGLSYPVGAFEALSCYRKAYRKIEQLREDHDIIEQELHKLLANVLLKIGDCSILIGDLEVGTDFYENALDCFKATETPHSLVDNAHVLVMIGFLQYTNARYSKALVMLQCATIMFQRMENNGDPFERLEFALLKSLLCFTNYETQQYADAVSLGLQAKRLFTDIYGEHLHIMNETYTWLTAQTLYIVSKSYQSMNLLETAIHTADSIGVTFGPNSNLETLLQVRVLELIGICYESQEQQDMALEYYNQALSKYKSQTNYGYASSALEHMLLSRTAGLHVSMQRYDEAAEFLTQSDSASKGQGDDIRSDMVSLLHHLGETHTLAGHIDRAIDCYTECLDVYLEIHKKLGPDMVKTLGKLANMHHASAVQTQCVDDEQKALFEAEKCYRQAMELDFSPVLALRYANFLFHQSSYLEAILILQCVLGAETEEVSDITFAGVEQILAPVLLQSECDEDELCLSTKILTQYLLVLSFCAIGKLQSSEYYLLDMIYESDFDTLSLSVIGYSMLELRLYTEAYWWFDLADKLSVYPASTVAWENKLFCVGLVIFRTLRRGFLFLFEFTHGVGSFPSELAYVC